MYINDIKINIGYCTYDVVIVKWNIDIMSAYILVLNLSIDHNTIL